MDKLSLQKFFETLKKLHTCDSCKSFIVQILTSDGSALNRMWRLVCSTEMHLEDFWDFVLYVVCVPYPSMVKNH